MEHKSISPKTIVVWLQLILLLALLMYLGKSLFIPLFLGLLISIILFPVCRALEKKGTGKALAITICLFIVSILFAVLAGLIIWQLKLFNRDAPVIFHKIGAQAYLLQESVNNYLSTSAVINNWGEKIASTATSALAAIFKTTSSALFTLFLTPIYTALFLYHRAAFVNFLRMVTPAQYKHSLENILSETVHTYFNYIKGMVLVYLFVGILNSVGLFALGVRHALLFGMLCSIMTIIPYIGIMASALLPISVVWIDTGNVFYPLAVIAVFAIVQYIEANVIFPKVVGIQLNVSTFAILVAVIAGGIVWGISGMILFIPFAAILKIVSGNIDELKPLNTILGRM